MRRGPGLRLLLNTPHPPTAGPRQACCSTRLILHNRPEREELAWPMVPARGAAGRAKHGPSGTQAADTPVAPTKDMAAAKDSREAMLRGGAGGGERQQSGHSRAQGQQESLSSFTRPSKGGVVGLSLQGKWASCPLSLVTSLPSVGTRTAQVAGGGPEEKHDCCRWPWMQPYQPRPAQMGL